MRHLDEGTIHAWLDGALAGDEAARVERHASECAPCAALVAEARGLVAGASRILSALDDVPAGVAGGGRGAGFPPARPLTARRRPLWSRPGVLAAAASLVLVAGSVVVMNETGYQTAVGSATAGDTGAAAGFSMAETASAASQVAPAAAPAAPGPANLARDGKGAVPGARPAPAPSRASAGQRGTVASTPQRRQAGTPAASDDARGAAGGAGRDAPARFEAQAVVTTAAPAAPAAPAAADAAVEQRGAGAEKAEKSAAAVTLAPPAPALVTAEGRAAARRLAARTDTLVVIQVDVDTVVLEPPTLPGLRGAGRAGNAQRAIPLTGCYEVVAGGLPRFITLTGTPVWSGVAEQRFRATAPGAVGYWSQVRRGDVHLMIAGALVTARLDTSTGELRGTAQRGGMKEKFVAKRGCR